MRLISERLKVLKGNLGVVLLSSGLWNLAGQMTWSFFPLYVLGLGGSYVDIGLISAMDAIVRIIPTLLGGYLADTIGRKKIVYTMSFLLAVNELIKAFAPIYQILFLSAAFGALWGGIREPAFSSIIADSTTPDNRALSYALWSIVPPLFGLFSPYAMGILMDRYGTVVALRWGYLFVFATGVVASFIRYRFLEESLTPEEPVKRGIRSVVVKIIDDFRLTFRSMPRQFWTFFSIDMVLSLGWAMIDPYTVTFAKEVAGTTAAQWGMHMMLWSLVNIVIRIPAARASDRSGRMKFIKPTMLFYPVAILFLINSRNFRGVLIARLAVAVLTSIDGSAYQSLYTDYIPREHRGRSNALKSLSWTVVWSIGSIIGGYLYQEYSKTANFVVGAGLLTIGAVALILFLKEPETKET
jgi:MFS family permease